MNNQHIDNNYPTPLKFLFLIIFYSQCVQYYKNNKKDFIIYELKIIKLVH